MESIGTVTPCKTVGGLYRPYDRLSVVSRRRWLGAIDGPGLRSSAPAHRTTWLITLSAVEGDEVRRSVRAP